MPEENGLMTCGIFAKNLVIKVERAILTLMLFSSVLWRTPPTTNPQLLLSTVTISHWTFHKTFLLLSFFSVLANRFPFSSIVNNLNKIQVDTIYLWPKTFSRKLSRKLFILFITTDLGGLIFFYCFILIWFCQILLGSDLQICICWDHIFCLLTETSISLYIISVLIKLIMETCF